MSVHVHEGSPIHASCAVCGDEAMRDLPGRPLCLVHAYDAANRWVFAVGLLIGITVGLMTAATLHALLGQVF